MLVEVRMEPGFGPIVSLTEDGLDVPFALRERELYEVGDAEHGGAGTVRYEDGVITDRITVSRPEGSFTIPFRLRKKTFELGDHTYRLGTIVGGHIRIWEDSTLAAKGEIFLHGVRLEVSAEALRPFACALAVGIARKVGSMQPVFPRV